MKYLFFVLTILCASSVIVEVASIDCPHATPLQISNEELQEQFKGEGFWTSKYIKDTDVVFNIWFPYELTELSFIRYQYQDANSMTATSFTADFDSESPDSPSLFYMKYKLNVDPRKPIFEITNLVAHGKRPKFDTDPSTITDIPVNGSDSSLTLAFALVYINNETDAWFSIYQSCDGQYGWAHIKESTIRTLMDQEKDPLVELSDKIDTALNALNIENGSIYNTIDNDVLELV